MTDHILIGLLIGMTSGIAALIVISAVTLRRFDVAGRLEQARVQRSLADLQRSWERAEETIRQDIATTHRELEAATRDARDESSEGARALRDQIAGGLTSLTTSLTGRLTELTQPVLGALRAHPMSTLGQMAEAQERQLGAVTAELRGFTETVHTRLDEVRSLLAERLHQMQADNRDSLEQLRADAVGHAKDLRNDVFESLESQIEQIRATVDVKLESTLQRNLDAHFSRVGERLELVSERLEQVHQGLVEVQTFAAGVGNIQRALAAVRLGGTKSRRDPAAAAGDAGARPRATRRRSKPPVVEPAPDVAEAPAP
jgi:DNA recombination protein RmuC